MDLAIDNEWENISCFSYIGNAKTNSKPTPELELVGDLFDIS